MSEKLSRLSLIAVLSLSMGITYGENSIYTPYGVMTQTGTGMIGPGDDPFDITKNPMGYDGKYYDSESGRTHCLCAIMIQA